MIRTKSFTWLWAGLLSTQLGTAAIAQAIDAQFYHLQIEVALDKPFIKGKTRIRYAAPAGSTQVQLSLAAELKVSKVDGATSFEQKGDALLITLSKPLDTGTGEVTVHYDGIPPAREINGSKKGLLYTTHGADKQPVIASVGYPNHGFLWFPCSQTFGDKADSIHVDVTIEERRAKFTAADGKESAVPFIAVSNGVLEGTVKGDKIRTFQWRHRFPILPQHIVLAVSNFAKSTSEWRSEQSGQKFPFTYYALPEEIEESKGMMDRSLEIMTCLTNTFGRYPFGKEGISMVSVEMDLGSLDGVPGQSCILLEDMKSVHIYRLVHNLGRMWFGNFITPEKWQDSWVTDALAAYAEGVWQEYKRGIKVYQNILDQKEYFDGGKLYLDKPEDYSEDRLNKKGMYAIHMLRGIMGEVYFFETLKGISELKRLKKNTISTKEFQQVCEYYASENVQQDYSYFFKEWIYGEYFPRFEVTYETLKKGTLSVHIHQHTRTTAPNFFTIPVKLNVVLEGGEVLSEIVKCDAADKTFTFPVTKNVTDVQFDADDWIFKELLFQRQILNTKTPIEHCNIATSDDRREITVTFKSPKKQDVTVEVIQLADGVEVKEDKIIGTQTFANVHGEFNKQFQIPLKPEKRGVYVLRIVGKSDIYKRTLRLKQMVNKFD